MSINNMLINGDSLDKLKLLPDNSVDLIVTDPPYGYAFMGKEWDKALPDKRIWKECLRVLKSGGFAYIMSAPRQDVLARMMIDLEDSGFKTDFTSMYWAYATGFPKALNMGKAIDKKLGVKSDEVEYEHPQRKNRSKNYTVGFSEASERGTEGKYMKSVATSPQAKKLDGSYAGFQPKPAVEVIIVCMKPIEEKSYIEQALANGKGVSWFDDCRIPSNNNEHFRGTVKKANTGDDMVFHENASGFRKEYTATDHEKGRYPANLLVSDNAVDTGVTTKATGGKVTAGAGFNKVKGFGVNTTKGGETTHPTTETPKDSGDFSRYFDIDKWWESQFIITPKASKSEKNKGCEDFEEKLGGSMNGTQHKSMKTGSGNERNNMLKNHHPTVKPLKLMSYLITLGSREGDVVLDPFMGSGTTPLASKQMGRKYIGIEREEEYYTICCARVGDDPTILEDKKEPLKEIKLEEVKSIEVAPPTSEEFICSICGVNYYGTTYQEHEKKPFHQGYI